MEVDLTPHDLRMILGWCESSSQGMFGALGGMASLRSITLSDRLARLLDPGARPDTGVAQAIAAVEEVAGRALAEEVAAVQPQLAALRHQVVYAGVVHSLPADDPRYWSVVDLQVEPLGEPRYTYLLCSDAIPVWRDGRACIGHEGEALRRAVRRLLAEWLDQLRQTAR